MYVCMYVRACSYLINKGYQKDIWHNETDVISLLLQLQSCNKPNRVDLHIHIIFISRNQI